MTMIALSGFTKQKAVKGKGREGVYMIGNFHRMERRQFLLVSTLLQIQNYNSPDFFLFRVLLNCTDFRD